MRARVGPDAVFVVVASLVFTAFPALSFNPAHAATTCQGLPPTIIGTPGNDAIDGTSADDVIVGRGGDDVINGSGGDDVICGNAGDDTLLGGAVQTG